MDQNNLIESGGFYFIHNFDSGNLGNVDRVPTDLISPYPIIGKTGTLEVPDYEFNIWTRPDCAGTEFENGNRTWFYFGIQAPEPGALVRLNLINLNKQGKMYSQGMAPVTRTLPGKPNWERVRERPIHTVDDTSFTLSFKFRTPENLKATTFFAFTYPYSFAELQIALNSIDLKMLPLAPPQSPDDIYYHRECLVFSLEGRRVDLLTITSHHGITTVKEERLNNLFPENTERPYKFDNKKVVFVSARVHPGETPSSFVFNGFLNVLLNRNDPVAIQLRKLYVFKLIPFLNPDGVARGHYRTDTRGVNLNRVYLNPSLHLHPTIYAARSLIRFYHFGCEKEDNFEDNCSIINISESSETLDPSPTIIKKKKASPVSKVDTFRRDRKATPANKLAGKPDKKPLTNEASTLIEQVCDLKLNDNLATRSDTCTFKAKTQTSNSVLQNNAMRSYLGMNVHLSPSSDHNSQGSNPLKPLRDTLKDSINLLLSSSSQESGEVISNKDSFHPNVKVGLCPECQMKAGYFDADRIAPIAMTQEENISLPSSKFDDYRKCETIEEYREQQRLQMDELEHRVQPEPNMINGTFFCTNCFKKYKFDSNMEMIYESGTMSGEFASADCMPASEEVAPRPPSITRPTTPCPVKEESKSRQSSAKAIMPPLPVKSLSQPKYKYKEPESGLHMYIDLHGHASKKGIFMYGNHFDETESSVECMMLPRIMSFNNPHFHFASCNFTERNMYLKDRRDGMSREGSGRVAVLKATGLVRSYTLECNYNTGRLVNVLPPTVRESVNGYRNLDPAPIAPKYTPGIYEDVGRSLCSSILDLAGQHPNSRMPASEHRTLASMRDWLRTHSRNIRLMPINRCRPKQSSFLTQPGVIRPNKVTEERKENAFVAAKADVKRIPPALTTRVAPEVTQQLNMRFAKRNDPVKPTRPLYLSETEPKPKSLTTKRRSILGIRKPNSSKVHLTGVIKTKISRRSAEDETRSSISKVMSKRSSIVRGSRSSQRCQAMVSSSSEDLVMWPNSSTKGRRRILRPAKKIKIKK